MRWVGLYKRRERRTEFSATKNVIVSTQVERDLV
jgi:hypothetical protein